MATASSNNLKILHIDIYSVRAAHDNYGSLTSRIVIQKETINLSQARTRTHIFKGTQAAFSPTEEDEYKIKISWKKKRRQAYKSPKQKKFSN